MSDFIATHRPLPTLTPEDRTYIQNNFYTLEELCLGRKGTPAEYPDRSEAIRDRQSYDGYATSERE
jgi:hypothetical protein